MVHLRSSRPNYERQAIILCKQQQTEGESSILERLKHANGRSYILPHSLIDGTHDPNNSNHSDD